jgi:hypothetical protein
MLTKCTKDYYTVCPSDYVLRKTANRDCLIASFTGKTTSALELLCPKKYLSVLEGVYRMNLLLVWNSGLSILTLWTNKCHF